MKNKREIEDEIRLNKYLSQAGVCSRRQADQLIDAGDVEIDGMVATKGTKVLRGQEVTVKGKKVSIEDELVFLVFNKPAGVVCTTSKKEKNNIIDYIQYPTRIYPVGRLDKDSTGLILLTNDGKIANEIMKARNYHEKEYEVTVNNKITTDFIHGMQSGVYLEDLDVTTRECKIKKEAPKVFRIILTQGLNRQIRRMCEHFGYRVLKLKRVRIMNIHLGRLKEGSYRKMRPDELKELKKELLRG